MEEVPSNYHVVQYIGGNYSTEDIFRSDESYFRVTLRAESDLEQLVHDKGFDHLYYSLCECGKAKCEAEIFSYYVLSAPTDLSDSQQQNSYAAFIPKTIRSNSTGGFEGPVENFQGDVCLKLGAGNMSGSYLKTNEIQVFFQL